MRAKLANLLQKFHGSSTISINRSNWGYRPYTKMSSLPRSHNLRKHLSEHYPRIYIQTAMMILILYIFHISVFIITVEAFCPKRCICDETQLEVTCHEAIGLQGVPITLNPQTKRISIKNNNLTTFHNIEIYRDLESLDLSHNGIIQLNLEKLETNIHLQMINASHNNILDIIDTGIKSSELQLTPVDIPLLPTKRLEIRTLLLDHNAIQTFKNFVFYRLPNINHLDVSYNKVQTVEPFTFIGIRNLEKLILKGNKIIQIPTLPISYLGCDVTTRTDVSRRHPINLEILDLSYNLIPVIPAGSLQSLQSLQELYLESCDIKFIEDKAFEGLTSLLLLSLDKNQLSVIPSKSLSHLTQLRVLHLNQNKLTEILPLAFSNLGNLEDLQLNNQSLTIISKGSFHGLNNLKRLEISSNKDLSIIEGGSFTNLSRLVYLNLNSNALTRLSEDLINSTSLSLLDVRNNPLNCQCNVKWLGHWLRRFDNKTIGYQAKSLHHPTYSLADEEFEYATWFNDSVLTRDLVDLKCAKPAALTGQLLINLHLDELECLEPTSDLHVQIGIGALLFIVTLMLLVCCVGFCLRAKDFLLVLKDSIMHRQSGQSIVSPFELDKPKVFDNYKNGSTLFTINTDAHNMYDTNLSYGDINEYSPAIYDDPHYQEPDLHISDRTYTDL